MTWGHGEENRIPLISESEAAMEKDAPAAKAYLKRKDADDLREMIFGEAS